MSERESEQIEFKGYVKSTMLVLVWAGATQTTLCLCGRLGCRLQGYLNTLCVCERDYAIQPGKCVYVCAHARVCVFVCVYVLMCVRLNNASHTFAISYLLPWQDVCGCKWRSASGRGYG